MFIMKIKSSTVTKLLLTDLEALDPVTVIVENYEPGKGKIIIECYGESWANYWGAMSGMTIQKFFCSAHVGYLAEKLAPEVPPTVPDEGDALIEAAMAHVKTMYDDFDLGKNEAEDLLGRINNYLSYGVQENVDLLYEIFGDEWWYCVPEKPNYQYEYLCRIIEAVREAFRENEDL